MWMIPYPINGIAAFRTTILGVSSRQNMAYDTKRPGTDLKLMPKITLLPGGQSADVPAGTLLLNAGEEAGVEMEAGCFNCSCGTCAVEIASGMENLEPPTDEELNVLDQWNKEPEKYRLTCCVKIQKGEVVIRLEH